MIKVPTSNPSDSCNFSHGVEYSQSNLCDKRAFLSAMNAFVT